MRNNKNIAAGKFNNCLQCYRSKKWVGIGEWLIELDTPWTSLTTRAPAVLKRDRMPGCVLRQDLVYCKYLAKPPFQKFKILVLGGKKTDIHTIKSLF